MNNTAPALLLAIAGNILVRPFHVRIANQTGSAYDLTKISILKSVPYPKVEKFRPQQVVDHKPTLPPPIVKYKAIISSAETGNKTCQGRVVAQTWIYFYASCFTQLSIDYMNPLNYKVKVWSDLTGAAAAEIHLARHVVINPKYQGGAKIYAHDYGLLRIQGDINEEKFGQFNYKWNTFAGNENSTSFVRCITGLQYHKLDD